MGVNLFKEWFPDTGGGSKGSGPSLLTLDGLIAAALAEDVGTGDITTEAVVSASLTGSGRIVAKEEIVAAGLPVAEQVIAAVDREVLFEPVVEEGSVVEAGTPLALLSGRVGSILTAERTALNFLQRLSGIATATRAFLLKVEGTGVKLLDTRKTTPCLRALERYAVKVGGGENHRFGLFDGVLIKDNHIDAAGGIAEAVGRARERVPGGMEIEVEVRNEREVDEALACGADIILLDNMDVREVKRAVKRVAGRAVLEVSGGVGLKNVAAIAKTGVDRISIGMITHSARSVDISLQIVGRR